MPNLAKLYAHVEKDPKAAYTLDDIQAAVRAVDPDLTDFTHAIYPEPVVGSAKLSKQEVLDLIRFIRTEFNQTWAYRDVCLGEEYAYHIFAAGFQAKNELGGIIGPMSKGGTLVPQIIRPVTVYANGGTTSTWLKSNVTAGWNATVWNIDLSSSTASNTVRTPLTRVEMLVIAEADLDPSAKLLETQWKEAGNKPLEIDSFPQVAMQGSSGLHKRKQAILIGANRKWTADFNYAAAGTSTPVAIGVQFAKSDYAMAQSS